VRIAITSLVMSTLLSWLFMPRFGPAGIAFGSSIAWTFNTVLHLYDLDRRIGMILQRTDWRTLGLVVLAALIASGAAVGVAMLTAAGDRSLKALPCWVSLVWFTGRSHWRSATPTRYAHGNL